MANNHQEYPKICCDDKRNYTIVWSDKRTDSDGDIYAQKYDAAGNAQLSVNGTAICSSDDQQKEYQLCCDNNGRTFIIWSDKRSGTLTDIYATCLDCATECTDCEPPIPSFSMLALLLCLFAIVVIFHRKKAL